MAGALAAGVEEGAPLIKSDRLVSSESTLVESELTVCPCPSVRSEGPREWASRERTPGEDVGRERVESRLEVVQKGVDL